MPVRTLIALAMAATPLVGCYTLQPARGVTPPSGTEIALDLNDRGRVAVGSSMGAEIAQVEGRLVEKTDSAYVVSVSTVRLLSGAVQVWSGEQVQLANDHVGAPFIRRFDKTRSVAVGATVIGGFAAFLVTRALRGSGSGEERLPRDPAQTQRGRP